MYTYQKVKGKKNEIQSTIINSIQDIIGIEL